MKVVGKCSYRGNVFSVLLGIGSLAVAVGAGHAVGQTAGTGDRLAGRRVISSGEIDTQMVQRRPALQQGPRRHQFRYGARFSGDIPMAPPVVVDYREFLGQPPIRFPVGVASSLPTGELCEFDIQCDDCNACTLDSCSAGVCAGGPNDGFGCENDVTCQGTCVGGLCEGQTCSDDTECCGDGDLIENGTCQLFPCTLFENDELRCVNVDITDRFVRDSECDDGLLCSPLGPTPTCNAGECIPSTPLQQDSNICDSSTGEDFGTPCETDEDCAGEDEGRCAAFICDDTGLQCDGVAAPPVCEDDADTRCAGDGRCVKATVACDAVSNVCQEAKNACDAPCGNDGDCDFDGDLCTNDVCCTGGGGDPPQCAGKPAGACVEGPNPCGPGATCVFDADQQIISCSSGRCCDPDEPNLETACSSTQFSACPAGSTWVSTFRACDTFQPQGLPKNICPLYSAGVAPPDSPVGTAVGPASFFANCPLSLHRVGDDYSFNSPSGFAEIEAFRWLSSVQFNARFTIEFWERDPLNPDRPMFTGQTFVPVVGGLIPPSGPVIRTVLFEPPMPISANGFITMVDAAEFSNKLGTFTAFTMKDQRTIDAGDNDRTQILLQRAGDPNPQDAFCVGGNDEGAECRNDTDCDGGTCDAPTVQSSILGECVGGDRDGLWCDVTNGNADCPGFGGGGTCNLVDHVLAFEIVGRTLDDEPKGGCCDGATASCSIKSVAECIDGGGVFRGVGVGCAVCLGGNENAKSCGPGGEVTETQCEDGGGTCTERVCEFDVGEACVSTSDCDANLNFCEISGEPCPNGDIECPGTGDRCIVNKCIDIAQCQVQAVCDSQTGTCDVAPCSEETVDPNGFGCGSTCDPNCCNVPREAITKKLCDGGGRNLQVCQVDADCPDGACKQVFARCRAIGTVESPVARDDLFAPASHDCDPTAPAGSQGCGVGEFCDGIALSGGDNCTQAQVPVVEVPSSANPDILVTVTATGNNFLARHDDFTEGVCTEGPNQGANCTPLEDPTVCGAATPACQRKGGSTSGLANPDGTNDPLWWEGFQVTFPDKTAIGDNCAWIRHDRCCTDPPAVPEWAGLWTGCPAGNQVPSAGAPPPIGLGRREGDLGRGSGFCLEGDISVVSSFGPVGPGTYFKPLASFPGSTKQPPITGGLGGTYQNHFSVAACPQAACCASLCVGGDRDGRPYNPQGLTDCPGPGAECIGGFCVGGIFEGLPCDETGVEQCPNGTEGPPGCALSNELECRTAGGFFNAQPFLPEERGTLVSCGTDPTCAEGAGSDNPCCIGSCCLGPGECEDEVGGQPDTMTKSDCDDLTGDFVGGPRCDFELPACPICTLAGGQNCQEGGTTFLFLADRSQGNVLADDFVAAGGELSEVCWKNFFGTEATGGTGEDCESDSTWSVRVFEEDRGLPGNIIFESGELENGESGLVGALNGDFQGDHAEWDWSIRLDPPVPLVPDDRYWVEISGRGSSEGECFIWVVNSVNVGNNFSLMDSFTSISTPSGNFWTLEDRIGFDTDWEFCVDTGGGQGATFDEPMPPGACCQCDGECVEVESFEECLIQNGGGDAPKPDSPAFEGKFTFGDGVNPTCPQTTCESLGGGTCPGEESGDPAENCPDALAVNDLGQCVGGKRNNQFCDPANGDADCAGPPDGACVPTRSTDPNDPEVEIVSFLYDNRCSTRDGRFQYPTSLPSGEPSGDNAAARFSQDQWYIYRSTCEEQGRVQFNLCNDFVPDKYDPIYIVFTNGTDVCPPCDTGTPPKPSLNTATPFVDDVCLNNENRDRDAPITPGLSSSELFATVQNQCFLIRVAGDTLRTMGADVTDGPPGGSARMEVKCLPTECLVAEAAETDIIENVASKKNRFLTITTGGGGSINRGSLHAIRVTIESLPEPFDGLAPAELWLGIPTGSGSDVERLSSIAGTGLGGAIPSSDARFTRVARLRCGPPTPPEPFFRDWTNLHSCRGGGAGVNATDCDPADGGACGGNPALCVRDAFIHMYHPLIIPGGQYRVEVIEESCDPGSPDSFSPPLVLDTPKFGDVAGGTNCSPPAENTWCASDGNTVVGDVVAAIDTFGNKPIGPIKPRAEAAGLGVSPVDGIIGVSDLVIWVDAVLGKPLTATPMAPPNVPPCGALGGTAAAGQ